MAFTIAHPAVVIPLRNVAPLSLLPLIVGSMTPDLVNFLPYALEKSLPHSHSLLGVVLADVPMGYLVLWLLQQFRSALVQPLWEPHRSCIDKGIRDYFMRSHPWRTALPSLLVGSVTHLVWDLFTHWSYFMYRHMPWLQQPLFPQSTHELPLFHALQYGTSIIGLCILGWYYLRGLRASSPTAMQSASTRRLLKRLLFGIVAIAILIGCTRFMLDDLTHGSIYSRVSLVLKTGIMSFSVLYLMCGMLLIRSLHRRIGLQPSNEEGS